MDVDPDYNLYNNDEQLVPLERVFRDHSNPFEMYDNREFKSRFRFFKEDVHDILELITPDIERETRRNHFIPSIIQICVVLRFYATGSYLKVIGDLYGLHESTVSRLIRSVSEAIARLAPRFIGWPEGNTRHDIMNVFRQRSRIPGIIGCIDCTHIRIESPSDNGVMNRKGYYSINTQVICDPNYRIINIVARWPGSTHDSRIFNNSRIKVNLENGNGGILLGDNGYALSRYLLTPFLNTHNRGEERYNYFHCHTRNIIERTFGIWKKRFSVLGPDSRIRLKVDTTMTVIVACAVLHNIGLRRLEEEDQVDFPGLQAFNQGQAIANNIAVNAFRQTIVNNYFD